MKYNAATQHFGNSTKTTEPESKISIDLGLLAVYIGTGEDLYPRLSMGTEGLARGFPITAAALGVLIIGAVFHGLEEIWWDKKYGW